MRPAAGGAEVAGAFNLKRARRSAEIEAIRRALHATGGNRTHAARSAPLHSYDYAPSSHQAERDTAID